MGIFTIFQQIYESKECNFRPKLGFMMSRIKIAAVRKNIFGKVVNLNKGRKFLKWGEQGNKDKFGEQGTKRFISGEQVPPWEGLINRQKEVMSKNNSEWRFWLGKLQEADVTI